MMSGRLLPAASRTRRSRRQVAPFALGVSAWDRPFREVVRTSVGWAHLGGRMGGRLLPGARRTIGRRRGTEVMPRRTSLRRAR